MNKTKNVTILFGDVNSPPTFKDVGNNNYVAHFSLLTKDVVRNDIGEKVTELLSHSIECWGNNATVVKNFIKEGVQVYVQGKTQPFSYEDKRGNKGFACKVLAEDLIVPCAEKRKS